MTLKQYKWVKLGVVFITAFIFSQSIVFNNFFIPVATLAVSWVFLMYMRKSVKEVIADERDYEIGGKSALLAMQIYAWVGVILMFGAYALQDRDPAYWVVAQTLAFSITAFMLLYSVIFRIKIGKTKKGDEKQD